MNIMGNEVNYYQDYRISKIRKNKFFIEIQNVLKSSSSLF